MSKESHNEALKLEIKIRGYNLLDNDSLRDADADCFDAKPLETIKKIMEKCRLNIEKFIVENKDILDKSLADILNDKTYTEKFNRAFRHLCNALDDKVNKQ